MLLFFYTIYIYFGDFMDMKNYIKQFDENKQVSMTGARALVIFIYILKEPRTFEEIRQFLIDCGVVSKEYSIDTIRIDINTLKSIGCEITKAIKKTNNKYGVISHPFRLKPEISEIDAIKKVYNKIAKTASPRTLLNYHRLFAKIADYTDDNYIKEQLAGISILKDVKLDLVEELVSNEKKHNKIRILYKPASSDEVEYDITLERIGVRSGKLYVFCYNHNLGTRSFLNVSRIKSIICNIFDKDSTIGLDVNVKFQLKSHDEYELDENETIIEEHEKYVIVEGRYFNEFIAVQRMLSFSPDCKVIEPCEIKEKVIEKLEGMRLLYEK